MSKPDKPKKPDTKKTGDAQLDLGKEAATWSQGLNAIDMTIPGQSVTYDVNKKGKVKGVNVSYDAANQQAFDTGSEQRNVYLDALPDYAFTPSDQASIDAVRKSYYDKGVAEVEPGLQRAEEANKLQLTERGIPIGSEIFTNENDRLAQDRANALTTISQNADLAAGAESDRILAQELAIRNQPFNELASYNTSTPMQDVAYPTMPAYSVTAPDISTPTYEQYNQDLTAYNTSQTDMWNGLLGLGKTALSKYTA